MTEVASVASGPNIDITFGAITEANVEQLKKLNLAVFPVRYNPKFYSNVAATSKEITQVSDMPTLTKKYSFSQCHYALSKNDLPTFFSRSAHQSTPTQMASWLGRSAAALSPLLELAPKR